MLSDSFFATIAPNDKRAANNGWLNERTDTNFQRTDEKDERRSTKVRQDCTLTSATRKGGGIHAGREGKKTS